MEADREDGQVARSRFTSSGKFGRFPYISVAARKILTVVRSAPCIAATPVTIDPNEAQWYKDPAFA